MKSLLYISRSIVGILFIFSGLIKANDPLGLSYKMQEFFEVWGWHALYDYTLAFSILMIAFEIIAGVAVLIGWQMRLFAWLLLLLTVFFTFLTGYALFSGKIAECGCFGDCIPLKANQSFIKDLILLVLVAHIFFNRNRIQPLSSKAFNISALVLTSVFAFAFQWYTLEHLPVVDCLPYKKGNNIPEKMLPPAGAIPDSTVITFVYLHNGKEVEFTSNTFPEDFNDSSYQYKNRYDKLVRKGNAQPAIRDFALQTMYGTDTTLALLSEDSYQLYLFNKDRLKSGDWMEYMNAITNFASGKNIKGFLVSNLPMESLSSQLPPAFRWMTPLRCDATAIKTAARANPTLILVKKGTVINKWSYADLDDALLYLKNL